MDTLSNVYGVSADFLAVAVAVDSSAAPLFPSNAPLLLAASALLAVLHSGGSTKLLRRFAFGLAQPVARKFSSSLVMSTPSRDRRPRKVWCREIKEEAKRRKTPKACDPFQTVIVPGAVGGSIIAELSAQH